MGMMSWEWERMGTRKSFPHISNNIRRRNTSPVSFSGLARSDPYELRCEIISCRGQPATFRIVETFATLLKVMRNDTVE